MDEMPGVSARRDGRVGRILLDRPEALNALTLPMVRAIRAAAEAWRETPEVHAVVIEGAGGRAFCAGGDIRAIRADALAGRHEANEAFFTEEYALNRTIAEYPKPWVALIDGICMGGGIGVSVHGTARVATERAVFAMPEVAIGMFPDIGASFFLPRLPGRLGLYLALSGARVEGAEAVHAGFATHLCPRDRLPDLSRALAEDGVAALAAFAAPLPPSALAPHRAAIDHAFAAPSVPEILARLEADGSAWARDTLAAIRAASPSALCWAFALLCAGAHRTLPQCQAAELALTRHVMRHPDFLEGVRAMVVDKDRAPRWHPARLEEVSAAEIRAAFA